MAECGSVHREAPGSTSEVMRSDPKIPKWELDPWARHRGGGGGRCRVEVDLRTKKWKISYLAPGTASASR